MPRTDYTAQLEALRNDVVAMGELVLDRYDMAIEAVEREDPTMAATVVEGDREVNTRYLALERDCIDLFALQQPVAGDLRFVVASFKIVTDLERVGDLATNLAADPTRPGAERYPGVDVLDVAESARDMVADALGAYATEDAAACWEIAERDDCLDARCEEAGRAVVDALLEAEVGADADAVRADASRLLVFVRDVERVGDHAVNIAARTLYMVDHDDSLLF